MTRTLPLRTRVTLLYTLMGFVLSVLFAGAVVIIAENYEHVLVREIMVSQVQDYAARLERDPATVLPRSTRLSAYLRRPDGTGEVPSVLALLPLGIHEAKSANEEGIHRAVFDTGSGRLYVTINLKDIEQLERYLSAILVTVVLLGILVSAGLGWLLSTAVIRPIRRLADVVQGLPSRPLQTELGRDMPRDELGRLGTAIDEYQSRLLAAEESQRTFFADASHELRTPISVVQGAAELLLEDSQADPGMRSRVARLDRGIRELSELLDALLRVARARPAASVPVALHEWLSTCLSGADSIKDGTVQLTVNGPGEPCELPAGDAELVILGVARRLLPPGRAGLLDVSASRKSIEFRYVQHDGSSATRSGLQPRPSDRRLGLTLIGKLAEQLGWVIDESEAESGQVVIRFSQPLGSIRSERSPASPLPRKPVVEQEQ